GRTSPPPQCSCHQPRPLAPREPSAARGRGSHFAVTTRLRPPTATPPAAGPSSPYEQNPPIWEYPRGVPVMLSERSSGGTDRRDQNMSTIEYDVTGMTCGHCEMSVREEVSEITGVDSVEVSAKTGKLVVTAS